MSAGTDKSQTGKPRSKFLADDAGLEGMMKVCGSSRSDCVEASGKMFPVLPQCSPQ